MRRMFTININTPKFSMTMYAQCLRTIENVEIWHKGIGHVDLQRLKYMQMQGIVTGLTNFIMLDMQKVCEASQFGKYSRHAFT